MAGERGFQYENSVYSTLLENNLTNSRYKPSGSGSGVDSAFKIKNKFYNLEIKLDLKADFGQGTLRYNWDDKKWESYADSQTMKELLDYFNVSDFANEKWTKIPNKVGVNDTGKSRPKIKTLSQREINEDKKNFPDYFLDLKGRNPIAEYYNNKNIYYIQIGYNNGFYYMGQDIANLGVPEFKPRGQKIRIRRKGSGGSNYRFTTALIINNSISSSLYNIDYNVNFLLNMNR